MEGHRGCIEDADGVLGFWRGEDGCALSPLPGTMLSQPEAQGVIATGLMGEEGSLTRSPGRGWRVKEQSLARAFGMDG